MSAEELAEELGRRTAEMHGVMRELHSTRSVVALGATVVLVLVAGVVSAFTFDPDGDDARDEAVEAAGTDTSDPSLPETSSTSAATTSSTEAETVSTTTTIAATATTTTAPAPTTTSEGLGEPGDPGPVRPPVAGDYRYRLETDDGTEETVTNVRDISRDGDRAVLDITQTIQGIRARNRIDWNPDRALLLESTMTVEGSDMKCDWEPDSVEGDFPLGIGTTWSVDSSCTANYNGIDVDIDRKGTTRVVRLERRTIAGEVLDLWVLESEEEISVSAPPVVDDTGTSKATTWFSPKHGLMVRTEGETSGSMGGQGEGGGSYTSELLNLTPA